MNEQLKLGMQEKLNGCKYCDSDAYITSTISESFKIIKCRNLECGISMQFLIRDMQLAIDKWNYTGSSVKTKRKIINYIETIGGGIAICNDGTLWEYHQGIDCWSEMLLPEIPQDDN